MSNKKKKKNNSAGNKQNKPVQNNAAENETAESKAAESKAAESKAAAEKEIDEENIPVQSLSEMLAFAYEAEEAMEAAEDNKEETPEKAEDKKPEPEKKEEKPVQEEKKPEPEKREEKPEQEEKKSEPAKPAHTAPNGMPITAAEAARHAASEDALDRDLEAARKKKLQEEAYLKRQRDIENQREAERIARAEQAKQRQMNAAAAAKKLEEAKAANQTENPAPAPKPAAAVNNAKPHKNAVNRSFNRNLMSMAAGRVAAIAAVIAILAYGGAFLFVNSKNDEFYGELEEKLNSRSKLVTDSSTPYVISQTSPLSVEEKSSLGLSLGLADSDKDGLSDYYEINVSKTDPLNSDSDGDTLMDGREVRAGLDPLNAMTDGSTPDGDVIRDMTVADPYVSAEITGIAETAYATVSRLENNSIQGTPGLVASAYEFYSDKNFDNCRLTFRYSESDLATWNVSESALSMYRFNDETLVFEKLASEINAEKNTVSAQITENGIYAICDSGVLSNKGDTNIFFLIDNSGSMYPEELCAGSEENDVEFKRLDFAANLIDMLGEDVSYGAGEFSGGYANIIPISDNSSAVKQKISDIRNKQQVFSGTEIAGAITSAVGEFAAADDYDKNYIILLTDGMPSDYNTVREQNAVNLARQNNITIFTIGLGKYIDADYLSGIASQTNGQFFQASNADALENIYDKIQSFMSYNQITIEEESGKKGYIVADSGFNVLKDGIGYYNFRSDFAPNGSDAGIAGLIRAYYTGELELSAEGYTTADGREIPGYDISAVAGFADGKTDLKNVEISALTAYNEYLALADKWNYSGVKGGTLHYTNDTRDFIESKHLQVTLAPYEFKAPEQSGFMGFLRTITFNRFKDFTQYECVLVNSKECTGDELAVMNMLGWFCGLHESDKCTVYDFGYEGDVAFDVLTNELVTGSPAVILYGGSAMNAVRIARDADNPDVFVIDAYDSNTPDRSTKINLVRTPVYDGESVPYYQYTASRGSTEEPLRVVIAE